jgi:hypothetical protein
LTENDNISYKKASTANTTTTTADFKNPIKKVHCVANKLFIVIDEEVAKHLNIREYDSWLEQIKTEDGILLRKYHNDLLGRET